MPKKKPIAKRLAKLFEDIKHVEPSTEAKTSSETRAVETQAPPAPPAKPVEKRSRTFGTTKRLLSPQADTALSLPFQLGQNNWATLQVRDESVERSWSEDEHLL